MFEPSLLLESPGRRDENITRICSSWNDSDLVSVLLSMVRGSLRTLFDLQIYILSVLTYVVRAEILVWTVGNIVQVKLRSWGGFRLHYAFTS